MAASVAMDGTMSILVAHELLHSGRKKDKLMASIALMPVAYMHWVPSHIAHHRKASRFSPSIVLLLCKTGYNPDPACVTPAISATRLFL